MKTMIKKEGSLIELLQLLEKSTWLDDNNKCDIKITKTANLSTWQLIIKY